MHGNTGSWHVYHTVWNHLRFQIVDHKARTKSVTLINHWLYENIQTLSSYFHHDLFQMARCFLVTYCRLIYSLNSLPNPPSRLFIINLFYRSQEVGVRDSLKCIMACFWLPANNGNLHLSSIRVCVG